MLIIFVILVIFVSFVGPSYLITISTDLLLLFVKFLDRSTFKPFVLIYYFCVSLLVSLFLIIVFVTLVVFVGTPFVKVFILDFLSLCNLVLFWLFLLF